MGGGGNRHLDSSANLSSLRGSGEATTKQSTKTIKEIDCHESANADSRNDGFLDCHDFVGTKSRNDEIKKTHNKRRFAPKCYFIVGIIFNLSLLGFFKYTDFLLENFNAFFKLTHFDFDIPLPHILLPLALSFVTFQQIAFLFDCYKRAKGELSENLNMDFIDYALFISFFPQLIAGPIVHHREMMPQFAALGSANSPRSDIFCHTEPLGEVSKKKTINDSQIAKIDSSLHASRCALKNDNKVINYEFLAKGIFIFSIGLFKKVFIADSFAKWANAGFSVVEKGEFLNIVESWATSLSYTFQLYFDFSGYCDMAIGLALMFGIILPLNFDSPYKSTNIAEFWRRWHITLGRFFKECLYIPLGGNRVGKIVNLRNLFIVAFLSGVWHGAGFGFIIWGILHGVAMVIQRIYGWILESFTKPIAPRHTERSEVSKKHNKRFVDSSLHASRFAQNDNKLHFTQTRFYKILCWLITFNFINIAWIFFRSENLSGALNLIKGMFGGANVEIPHKWSKIFSTLQGGTNEIIIWIVCAFIVCLALKNSVEMLNNFDTQYVRFRIALRIFSKKIYLKGGAVFTRFVLTIALFYIAIWVMLSNLLNSNAYTPFLYFNF